MLPGVFLSFTLSNYCIYKMNKKHAKFGKYEFLPACAVCRTSQFTCSDCSVKTAMVRSFLHCTFLLFRHVQVSNEVAIEFYKKFDFEIIDTKKQYYKRIDPADAYVLQKTIRTRKS